MIEGFKNLLRREVAENHPFEVLDRELVTAERDQIKEMREASWEQGKEQAPLKISRGNELPKVDKMRMEYKNFLSDVLDEPGSVGVLDLDNDNLIAFLYLGGKQGLFEASSKFLELAGEQLTPATRQSFELGRFLTNCDSRIRFKGVRLADFLEKGKVSAPQGFDFLTSSLYFLTEPKLKGFEGYRFSMHEGENKERCQIEFPNLTRNHMVAAAGDVKTLLISDSDPFRKSLRSKYRRGSMAEKAAKHASKFLSAVSEHRESIYESLFDPNNPDNPALREKMEAVLGSYEERMIGLLVAKIFDSPKRVIDSYRLAVELSKGDNGDFYEPLSKAIALELRYIGVASGIRPLGRNEIECISRQDGEKLLTIPQWEQLEAKSNKLKETSGKQGNIFEVENINKRINWGVFVSPEKALLEIDPSNPAKFEIKLFWLDDKDNEIQLCLSFDSRKNKKTFDWNILDSPDCQNYESLRTSCFLAADLLLDDCLEKFEAGEIETDSKLAVGAVKPEKKDKQLPVGEHYQDPIYRLRREFRKELSEDKSVSPLDLFLRQGRAEEIPEGVLGRKITIELPDDDEESRKIKWRMKEVERPGVLQEVIKFNKRGTGNFVKLPHESRKFGVDLYRLAFDTDHGPVRVICEKISGKYYIVEVVYRKDAYKDKK